MIQPVNGHLLVEPVTHDSFMATEKDSFEEIGIVVAVAEDLKNRFDGFDKIKVYFDSWLIAKYPNPDDKDKVFWLIRWEDVRAIERQDV